MEELQDACDRECKKKRLEKIVNIVWTIVKVVGGMLIGQQLN